MTSLSHLRKIAAQLMFACAALVLTFGPTVDAVAGAARMAVEAGHAGGFLKALAAFDVIDDTLDHLPGKLVGEAQQQHLAVPLPPPVVADAGAPSAAPARGWALRPAKPLASRPSESLERPPRA